jgi:hypothetical protein
VRVAGQRLEEAAACAHVDCAIRTAPCMRSPRRLAAKGVGRAELVASTDALGEAFACEWRKEAHRFAWMVQCWLHRSLGCKPTRREQVALACLASPSGLTEAQSTHWITHTTSPAWPLAPDGQVHAGRQGRLIHEAIATNICKNAYGLHSAGSTTYGKVSEHCSCGGSSFSRRRLSAEGRFLTSCTVTREGILVHQSYIRTSQKKYFLRRTICATYTIG